MQHAHYSGVARNEEQPTMEVKQKIVPLDLESVHNRQNRGDHLTLKAKWIIPLVFILLTFPLAIIMLLLSLARKTGDVSKSIGVLETISYISQSNPVVDIQPITGSQVCEDDTYEPGSLGLWKGTEGACYCSTTGTIEKRQCTQEELDTECEYIPQNYKMETFTWNGDRFCMKRLYTFVRTAGNCPTGYTKCGDLFCSPPGEACPVSDVQILARTDPVPAGYTSRPMTFDKMLVFINDPTANTQFAQFSYSTSDPCLDAEAYAKRTNDKEYSLEWQKYSGCGEYDIDKESKPLDTTSEQDYYLSNFVNEKTDALPLFSDVTSGSTMTISARYRFKTIKKDMCAQFYVSDVPKLVDDVEDFSELYRGISITAVILSTITSIIAIVYIKVIKRDGFFMMNREEPFGRRFIVQIILLITLFGVTTAVLGNIKLRKVNWQESYLKDLESENCFETQEKLNEAMDDITSYLTRKIDGLVFLNNLWAVLSLIVAVALIALIFYRRSKQYDRD